MPDLKLRAAQKIVAATLKAAREAGLQPVAAVVLDARGALKAAAVEDGTSLRRAEIALGKAHGALAMGLGSRAVAKMAAERPQFVAAATHAIGPGGLIPAPGGVLILDRNGATLGALGVSGDLSDNDERAAITAIAAAGLRPEAG